MNPETIPAPPVPASAPAPPASAKPPREIRFPLTADDLGIVLWLVEQVWETGAVKSTAQAAHLLGLSARIAETLRAARAAGDGSPEKGPAEKPRIPSGEA